MVTSSIKVLVIEDLQIAQIVAHNIFKKLNCNVHIVIHAGKALEQVFKIHYDIIFVDIQLPDINGFEFAKTIRGIERQSTRIPLIAVTANSYEHLEAETKEAGFDDFVIKPLTIESARHILLKHLNKSKLNLNKDY